MSTPQRWTVLVTGATGRIGFPVARALARDHDVYGFARCRNPGDEARLRHAGVVPVPGDVADFDPASLPGLGSRPISHVFHAGARVGPEAREDWQRTFEVNAHATGRLISACAHHSDGALRGFVFCSSGSTYEYQGHRPLREDDPPGVHLGVYSLSKIAGEAVARSTAAEHGVPLTIIRIFSTYGPLGGAPADRLERIMAGKDVVLHPDRPNNYNPIYEDDYVRQAVRALDVASQPETTVNWAGSETVSAEEYCAYLASLVGRPVRFRYEDRAPWPIWPDVTRMHEILGRTRVPWREGMRRMVEARHPEALAAAP
jgi:UDP-glucuronate 4-epimerase